MMDSLAADAMGTGVRVNSILPSIIDTPANRKAMPGADFDSWPKPDELAQVILFLSSNFTVDPRSCDSGIWESLSVLSPVDGRNGVRGRFDFVCCYMSSHDSVMEGTCESKIAYRPRSSLRLPDPARFSGANRSGANGRHGPDRQRHSRQVAEAGDRLRLRQARGDDSHARRRQAAHRDPGSQGRAGSADAAGAHAV